MEYLRGILPLSLVGLNLESVRGKLIERAEYGREKDSPPVPLERLDDAILDYKRYLFLNLKYPGFPVAPSYDIDEVWHQHILFTRKYAADCQNIFGEMRHHVPHFGRDSRNPEEDTRILNNTRALWEKEFGYVPKSYEGMTALTSDNGWSGNVDLTAVFTPWPAQLALLS
jgi:hypothetical protein